MNPHVSPQEGDGQPSPTEDMAPIHAVKTQASTPKLYLVASGGAMRGFFNLGVMQEVWQKTQDGQLPPVERFYTASVGVTTALGYLHPEGPLKMGRAYLDMVALKGKVFTKFIDRRRVWKIADIDYLVDEVVLPNFPMNDQTFARTEVMVSVMDAKTGDITYHRLTHQNIRPLLRATMSAPIMYNKPVLYEGRRVVDAAIAESAPLLEQIAYRERTGHQAVTGLILTRGLDEVTNNAKIPERVLRHIWPLRGQVKHAVRNLAPWRDVKTLELARAGRTSDGLPIVVTTPDPQFRTLSATETNALKLGAFLMHGEQKSKAFADELAYQLQQLASNE